MSWLDRRRLKKAHPWPPHDARVLPQLYRGSMVKAVFADALRFVLPPLRPKCCLPDKHGAPCGRTLGHNGECAAIYHMPVPQTAEQLRDAGIVYVGAPK